MFFVEGALDFGRYTMEARGLIAHALASAQAQGGGAIGPEHLALGLLNGDVHASGYLPRLGVRTDDLRTRLLGTTRGSERGAEQETEDEGLPLTPEVKAILRRAYQATQDAGREKVTSGDILLALAESESVVAEKLKASGVSADAVRNALSDDQVAGTLPSE